MTGIPHILACLAALLLAGCASKGTPKPDVPASVQADQLKETVKRGQEHTAAATKTIAGLTPANVLAQQPVAAAQVGEIKNDWNDADQRIEPLKKSAKQEEQHGQQADKRIAELEAANPVRTWLRWIGGGMLVLGVLGLVLAGWLRNGTAFVAAGLSVVAGLGLVTLAEFLTQIMQVMIGLFALALILCLAAAAWMAWKWRQNLQAAVSTQIGVGLINPTEEQKRVLRTAQTPQAEAIFRTVVKPKLTEKHR